MNRARFFPHVRYQPTSSGYLNPDT